MKNNLALFVKKTCNFQVNHFHRRKGSISRPKSYKSGTLSEYL